MLDLLSLNPRGLKLGSQASLLILRGGSLLCEAFGELRCVQPLAVRLLECLTGEALCVKQLALKPPHGSSALGRGLALRFKISLRLSATTLRLLEILEQGFYP